jgi:hypothetical protein
MIFHISDPHNVFCIGNVAPNAGGEENFLNLANMWGILNIKRALESGWPVSMSGWCSKQINLVSSGVYSIPAKFNTLNYCIRPVENKDLYSQSWDGVKCTGTFLAVMRDWKCCAMSYTHCKICPLITHFRTVADSMLRWTRQ